MKKIILFLVVSFLSISAQAASNLKCNAIKRSDLNAMPTWLINSEIIPVSNRLEAKMDKTVEDYNFSVAFYNSNAAFDRVFAISITQLSTGAKVSADYSLYNNEIKVGSSQEVTITNSDGTVVALSCKVN